MNRPRSPLARHLVRRRHLLQGSLALAAGTVAAALAGCGGSSGGNNKSGSSQTTASSAAAGTRASAASPTTVGNAGTTISGTATLSAAVKRGGTHTAPWETEPSGTLDPHIMKPGFVYSAAVALFNGFMRQDQQDLGKLVPELALSWESPDATVFTFKLRTGVKFHDGTDYDADVAKWNVERITGTGFVMEGAYTGAAAGLTKIEAIDPATIKFTFDKPKVNSIEAFYWAGQSLSGAVSRKAAEAAGKDFWKAPVGTGPFAFESWDFGSKLSLKRNDQYFETLNGQQLPFVDRFVQISLPDPAVRAVNLKSGQISSASLPSKDAQDLASKDLKVVTGGVDAIGFYPNHQTGVFKDAHIRRALAYAIDREALAKTVFFGLAQPTVGIPKESKWYDPTFKGFTYDPKRAKDELAAAGMPNGFEFEAMVLPTGDRPKAVEFMQAQLAPLGIKINIKPTESSAYVDQLMVRGQGDTFYASTGLLGLTETAGFDASGAPSPGRKENPNDPKMIDYVNRIAATFDVEARKALIKEAQNYYWYELVAVIPTINATPPQVVRAEWAGLGFVPPLSFFPDYRAVGMRA